MRVLVTGGTGYLGGAIVRALHRHGHEPVVFARHASAGGLPGRAIDGDIRDSRAVDAAAAEVDAVCHTAALVSVWRPRPADFDEINVGGLENVIDACRRHELRRLVYTSSFLARPPADGTVPLSANDYQRTKAAARSVAIAAARRGLPIVVLYPGVVYGPGAATEGNLVGRLIDDHLSHRLPGIIGADLRWSYAYVDDVAEGHVAALERGEAGGEYELGGENAPQMRVFEIVRDLTGAPLPRRIAFPLAVLVAWLEEGRTRLTGQAPRLTRRTVEIFRHDWSLDSSRAIAALGYRITPLTAGIRAVLDARSAAT